MPRPYVVSLLSVKDFVHGAEGEVAAEGVVGELVFANRAQQEIA